MTLNSLVTYLDSVIAGAGSIGALPEQEKLIPSRVGFSLAKTSPRGMNGKRTEGLVQATIQ